MGWMDKAKQLAEQAQQKLDEAQKQFNSSQPQQQGGGVAYDEHGRPADGSAASVTEPAEQGAAAAQAPPAPPAGDAPNVTPDPFKPLQ